MYLYIKRTEAKDFSVITLAKDLPVITFVQLEEVIPEKLYE